MFFPFFFEKFGKALGLLMEMTMMEKRRQAGRQAGISE